MKKNLLVWLLVLIVIIIWSNNIYKIVLGVKQADNGLPQVSLSKANQLDNTSSLLRHEDKFVYQAKYRDPFQNWFNSNRSKNRTKPKKQIRKLEPKQEPRPPDLLFSGILQDKSDILAIIENPSGDVYFVAENDVVEGVTMLKISKDKIYCMFGKHKFEIMLKPYR